jgi:hypothetical protein
MAKAHYGIVEHYGGWAYPPEDAIFGDFCDESRLQKQPLITLQLSKSCRGNPKASSLKTAMAWRTEHSAGDDRPGTDVA